MSGSPRSEHFDDIYFAVEDGFKETKHVFLAGNGLPGRWQQPDCPDRFVIAETGFGTGLNFLSVWQDFEKSARPDQHLHFISFEKYPLSASEIKEYLSVWADEIGPYLDRLVDVYPLRVTGWHSVKLMDRVSLLLIFDDVNRAMPELEAQVDAWFLDGHAPAKNPEMWSDAVFDGIGRNSVAGTTFATFTAAGVAKRGLQAAGFKVNKQRGFGRKRDMLVGVFEKPKGRKVSAGIKSVAIIGGGLAGTAMAHALRQRRISCDIFEKDHLAAGASGNARGLFNPRFAQNLGAESDFYGAAYALAVGTFKTLADIGYHECGSVHLATDADKLKRFKGLLENWGWHEDHVQFLNPETASKVAGISLKQDALYLPQSGSVDPSKVCKALAAETPVIPERVSMFERSADVWHVNGRIYDAIVIANGAECLTYEQASSLPLHTVRGQISYAAATDKTSSLKTNLCYGGYVSAPVEGRHAVGSTFQPWLTDTDVKDEDHQQIMSQLSIAVPALDGQLSVDAGRAALRTASKDRVPVIGCLEGQAGLYISTAHGSHGLLSSLLAAEMIAAEINGEPPVLPQSVLRHVSPSRFVERARKKAG
jgi:tRNA 5-methylaminomethyl-2-thiouridine biosynthesis bifunctional protein